MPLFPDAPIRVRIRGRVQQRAVEGLMSVAVDVDGVILVPLDQALHPGAPIRVAFETLDGVAHDPAAGILRFFLRGGEQLEASGDAKLGELALQVSARGRTVPELTRALRTLGGHRGGSGQDAFFRPLLAARREAAAGGDAALAAFDADALRAAIERALARFAGEREPERPAARRALEARLSDAAAPLFEALHPLHDAAARARDAAPPGALRAWRDWAVAVHHVFVRADAAWLAVRSVLDAPPPVPPPGDGLDARWRRAAG